MPGHKPDELRRELRMTTALEVSVDAVLERDQIELLEPADLGYCERRERDLGERVAPPERERLPQLRRPRLGLGRPRLAQYPFEATQVDRRG